MTGRTPEDEAMSRVLTDRAAWAELIATPAGLDTAEMWLSDAYQAVLGEQAQRKAEWEADVAARVTTRADYQDYQDWRSRALGFKRLVERRLAEVKRLRKSLNNNRVHDERQQLQQTVIDMGRVVEHSSDPDVRALLDSVQIPFGPSHTPTTLRSVLGRLDQL
jgi:hypothetical protein